MTMVNVRLSRFKFLRSLTISSLNEGEKDFILSSSSEMNDKVINLNTSCNNDEVKESAQIFDSLALESHELGGFGRLTSKSSTCTGDSSHAIVVPHHEKLEFPMPSDFTSYDSLKNYTISQIFSIGLCASLATDYPNSYLFFRQLFQRHPSAIRKKVDIITDIRFKRYPHSKVKPHAHMRLQDYQIFILTSDGEEDSISWVKSIRCEDFSVANKLTKAFRYSIDSQIRAYRAKNWRASCKECSATRSLTVDHINHIEGLVYDFLALHPDHPTEFDKDPVTSQDRFHSVDAAYDSLWKEFHKSNAQLQILCLPCNMSRPMYKSPVTRPEKRWSPSTSKHWNPAMTT